MDIQLPAPQMQCQGSLHARCPCSASSCPRRRTPGKKGLRSLAFLSLLPMDLPSQGGV